MRPYLGDLLPPTSAAAAAPLGAAPRPPPPLGSSPVPYLFGGIAAMLGVIALALLLLACSYWKLSGDLDSPSPAAVAGDDDGADDRGAGAAAAKAGVVVIVMAGEEEPSFLGVPVDAKPREAGIYKGPASEGTDKLSKNFKFQKNFDSPQLCELLLLDSTLLQEVVH
ncbi:Protein GLUTAMINE DUMPER 4 [Ananas comosus]|uniref:Protein GLUTAMINE DUMPER 4 n=1 Tax=Ananas comosus TaxID=4615 RepID=A0A199V3D8_ANACO|nr:Protein GLUTAMINE DUMPER 4 [Ananas comosus]